MKLISKQLEEKEVPLCVACKENPSREGMKTCSKECSIRYQKVYKGSDEYKVSQKAYQKAYQKTEKYKAYKKAYQKTEKYKAYQKEYRKRQKLKKKMEKDCIKCSYPGCERDAEVMVGMADPNAEQIPYCKKCAEKVKMNTINKVFRSGG